ncbi:MAG: tryptophan--tRNA ligase [Chloroflexi bacterium]|nr:tryptophan--tRNA ligase [Chloroflexota bacterium]
MTEQKRKRVFSGIQPSGDLTIGNYIGAIRQWVQHQHEFNALYCVVDLHAITAGHDPASLAAKTREVAAIYIACGIDPAQSIIFAQSHVTAHAELGWLLTCVTPIGWLQRMTQFKDKAAKQDAANVSNGLLSYPVLMAADILLYHTEAVPVGDDQKQHLELTRDIAQRFNHMYGEIFTIPEVMLPLEGARVMGLDNPLTKMSKSEKTQYHAVHLLDNPDQIRKSVMRAVTDSGSLVTFSNDPERAGVNNLLTIYQALVGGTQADVEAYFVGKSYGDLKKAVAEVVAETLKPIQARYAEITADETYLNEILASGADRARELAAPTLQSVYQNMGFLPVKQLQQVKL